MSWKAIIDMIKCTKILVQVVILTSLVRCHIDTKEAVRDRTTIRSKTCISKHLHFNQPKIYIEICSSLVIIAQVASIFPILSKKIKKIVHQKCVESTKVQFLSLNKKRQLCNFLSQFLKLAIQTIFTRIASFLHTMLTLFLENPSLRITILTFF